MLKHPTIQKLQTLKLFAMAEALAEDAATGNDAKLVFEDRLGLIVDREISARASRQLTRRLQRAKLRYQAAIEDVDFAKARSLDKSLILDLASCNYIQKHHNILLSGATGAGKSFLACALGHRACREGFTAAYFNIAHLGEAFDAARADGGFPKLMRELGRVDLLVIDDFGLVPLTPRQKQDLWRIFEDRYELRSTIITSQFPIAKWHDLIADPTIADAILDRIAHNAYKIELKGGSLRKAQRSDGKK